MCGSVTHLDHPTIIAQEPWAWDATVWWLSLLADAATREILGILRAKIGGGHRSPYAGAEVASCARVVCMTLCWT